MQILGASGQTCAVWPESKVLKPTVLGPMPSYATFRERIAGEVLRPETLCKCPKARVKINKLKFQPVLRTRNDRSQHPSQGTSRNRMHERLKMV